MSAFGIIFISENALRQAVEEKNVEISRLL